MNAREVTPSIVVADQPSESELTELRAEGFAAVVNLRHDGEPEQPLSTGAEGQLVRSSGLAYLSHSIGGVPLSREGVDAVCDFIDAHEPNGKVLVHCRKGGRAVAMAVLHQARRHGWAPSDAVAKAKEMGLVVEGSLKMMIEQYLAENYSDAQSN